MSKKDNITLLAGGDLAGSIDIVHSGNGFKFIKDIHFDRYINSPLKTDDGRTVGERNREQLHRFLDMFLDKGSFEDF